MGAKVLVFVGAAHGRDLMPAGSFDLASTRNDTAPPYAQGSEPFFRESVLKQRAKLKKGV